MPCTTITVTRHFWLLSLVPGVVCLSTSPWHPHYDASEHLWRPTYMHFPSGEFSACELTTHFRLNQLISCKFI